MLTTFTFNVNVSLVMHMASILVKIPGLTGISISSSFGVCSTTGLTGIIGISGCLHGVRLWLYLPFLFASTLFLSFSLVPELRYSRLRQFDDAPICIRQANIQKCFFVTNSCEFSDHDYSCRCCRNLVFPTQMHHIALVHPYRIPLNRLCLFLLSPHSLIEAFWNILCVFNCLLALLVEGFSISSLILIY